MNVVFVELPELQWLRVYQYMSEDQLSVSPSESYNVNLNKELDNNQEEEYSPIGKIIINQLQAKFHQLTSSANSGLNSKFSKIN